MIHLGQAAIDDLLEGFVAFRRLCPIDARLHAALPRQSPPTKDVDLAIPRKGSAAHAEAVAGMLRAARDIDREEASRSLSHFLYIGDSAGADGRAFASLCRVTGWSGRALIIEHNGDIYPCDVLDDTVEGFDVLAVLDAANGISWCADPCP